MSHDGNIKLNEKELEQCKEEAVAVPEAKKDWFVGNNLNDKIYTGSLDEIKDKLDKDQNSSRYYRDSKLTPDGY